MSEDLLGFSFRAKLRKRGNHSKSDYRHGDELKEAGEDGSDEAEQFVQPTNLQPAKESSHEREKPERDNACVFLKGSLSVSRGTARLFL